MKTTKEDTLLEGVVNQSSKELVKVFQKILEEKVPMYEWCFQRFEKKYSWSVGTDFNTDNGIVDTKWVFGCGVNGVRGYIHLSFDKRNQLDAECVYYDEELPCSLQSRSFYPNDVESIWDKVRDFFNTFMVSEEQKIQSKVITPRVERLNYELNNYIFEYERNLILTKSILSKYNINIIENLIIEYENEYKPLDPDYVFPYDSVIGIIEDYLEEQIYNGELEYWLKEQITSLQTC